MKGDGKVSGKIAWGWDGMRREMAQMGNGRSLRVDGGCR